MMLNHGFEVDVKIRKDTCKQSGVRRGANLDGSRCELGEEITPAAMSE
jgi:hypothetical protein